MKRIIRWVPLVVLCLLVVLPTFAAQPENAKRNFDVRDDHDKISQAVKERHLERHGATQKEKKEKIQQAMKKAEKRLEREISGLEVKHSERTGAPETVGVAHGRGKLTRGNSDSRENTLRRFLRDNAELFGLDRNEVNQLVKDADYVNPSGNLGWVRLQRKIKGKNVFRGELQAVFNASGELVAMTGELPAGVDDAEAKDEPLVPAVEAIVTAAKSVGVSVSPAELTLKESEGNTLVFSGGPFTEDTRVELQYFPLDIGVVELAYSFVLWIGENEAYSFVAGAEVNDILFRKNIVDDQTQPATYRVYDGDSPAPLSPSTALPGLNVQGTGISRTLFTLVSEGPSFNDLGWIPDGGNTTTGNNVDAGLDLVSPDGIDAAGRPAGSPFRVFDFAYNPAPAGTDPPTNTDYRWGEVANMFFWSNRYHDRLYELGFTEAARNFQQNNFGRGGVGNDRVLAQAQDFSGTNNANFLTPSDGTSGRMQMYVFTGPNPDRVSALDQEILVHELTHGTSNRLHSNANGLNNTMSGGMGEGWSDFYARAMTSGPEEDVNGVYAMGGYSTLQIVAGYTDNYYYGIRRFPYALMSSLGPNGKPYNPLTFADIDPAQINLTDGAFPRGPIGSSSAFAVHNIGEVWASALFEVRARIINRVGWAAGNQRALQIVTDGMKLDPVNPTLLQGRNSILTADCAGFAGADELDIWNGFAVRGMGYSAVANSSASGTVVQAFDLPNLILGTPVVSGGSCDANDGVADPGETVVISFPITNPFCATPANGVLVSLDGGAPVNVGSIAAGATVNVSFNYSVPTGTCGTQLHPVVAIASSLGNVNRTFNLQVGTPVSVAAPVTYSSGNVSVPLADVAVTEVPIAVTGSGSIADVNVRFRANHTFDGDLVISLVAPDGTVVPLANNRGGSGDNFGSGANDCSGTFTTFDDSAATAISSGVAPFANSYRPETPLSALKGKEMNGTWKLRFSDVGSSDVGTLFCAQLVIARQRYFCCGVPGVPEVFAAPPAVITAESVAPANNALDPHETVTVQLPLQNFGTGATANLVATLQPTGGVLAPSAPQNYGALSPTGGAVSRPFTFVVGGSCGDTVTATLQLQDGTTNLGTATFTFLVGTLPPPVSNPAAVTIPSSGAATPYPSTINVSGITGPVTKVTATLHSLTHTFPGDLDVLLVGPGGQKVMLMSDVGSGTDVNNVTLTFSDGSPSVSSPIVSGTYAPTNSGTTDPFPAPAPAAPYGTSLSAFNGVDPNGTWQLFIVDDAGGDSGTLSGGWSLKFTAAPLCASQPCTLSCPPTVFASTAPNQPGAYVTFAAPALSGSCGVVSTTPLSGSFFPIGTTVVNGSSAASVATCAFNVVVTDVQPPVISGMAATPNRIIANNHKMVDVTVSYTSSDNSGSASACSLAVTSSEPLNGSGDGNTEVDWEVIDATHVRLRAERAGNGTDRTYTITATCADAAGNSTSSSTTVVVPHDAR